MAAGPQRLESSVWVMSDVHGQLAKLTAVLRGAGLTAPDLTWAGGEATLWFLGDLVDRGPDGIAVVELVMRLQGEAAAAGGRVGALLGNHELLLLAADRFGNRAAGGPGGSFRADWERNGGVAADLAALTPRHVAWLRALPPTVAVGDTLLVHADALFYLAYGRSVAEVTAAFAALLRGDDAVAWDRLLDQFSERFAFRDEDPSGGAKLDRCLRHFGARRLVHGHTPIAMLVATDPDQVRGPHVYAGGRCVDVDPGLYLGGPGFLYRLPPSPEDGSG